VLRSYVVNLAYATVGIRKIILRKTAIWNKSMFCNYLKNSK